MLSSSQYADGVEGGFSEKPVAYIRLLDRDVLKALFIQGSDIREWLDVAGNCPKFYRPRLAVHLGLEPSSVASPFSVIWWRTRPVEIQKAAGEASLPAGIHRSSTPVLTAPENVSDPIPASARPGERMADLITFHSCSIHASVNFFIPVTSNCVNPVYEILSYKAMQIYSSTYSHARRAAPAPSSTIPRSHRSTMRQSQHRRGFLSFSRPVRPNRERVRRPPLLVQMCHSLGHAIATH